MSKIKFEDFFLTALGDGRNDRMLKWYLETKIDLVYYLDSTQAQIMGITDFILKLIPKEKRKEMVGDTSSARILKLLETERPLLYKTLTNCSWGVEWLEFNIENFKRRFL